MCVGGTSLSFTLNLDIWFVGKSSDSALVCCFWPSHAIPIAQVATVPEVLCVMSLDFVRGISLQNEDSRHCLFLETFVSFL